MPAVLDIITDVMDYGDEVLHQSPLRARVREALERRIVDGTYKPGQHIIETEVAKRLGVSRGPIREAIHELHLQGWVDLRPRQGAFVHEPSIEEIEQFFHVRALLESEATALAVGRASPEVVDEMQRVISDARAAIASGDDAGLISSNNIFHDLVHGLARNDVLNELLQALNKRVRWYSSPVAVERSGEAWNEHEALMEAIVEGAHARAVAIIRAHSEKTRETCVRLHIRTNADASSVED